MNYEESVTYINGKSGFGKKIGLRNMERLLDRLGNPHRALRCIHVAGTNGKGSTCAFIDSVLRAGGAKVGLYTSPYLMRFNERMRINGEPIPDETLAALTTRVRVEVEAMEQSGEGLPTVFEIGTAIMFLWFCEEKVDWAVVEVGLGGRFDPTNVLQPTVCVIARIGLDHTRVLGDTIEKIAAEKGGIIKKNVPVVLQKQEKNVYDVISAICKEKNAPLLNAAEIEIEDLHLSGRGAEFTCALPGVEKQSWSIHLCGSYQVDNAVTALGALSLLPEKDRLPQEILRKGLAQARWPGRLEWINNILLDGAHNPQGAQTVREYARDFLSDRRVVLLTGMMADKDVHGVVENLSGIAQEIFCVQPENIPRAMRAENLKEFYEKKNSCPVYAVAETLKALKMAEKSAGQDGVVLVCGSLYLVGEVRVALMNSKE